MAKKKRNTVMRLRESPNCPLFKLPTEISDYIYELAFEVGGDEVHIVEAATLVTKDDTTEANDAAASTTRYGATEVVDASLSVRPPRPQPFRYKLSATEASLLGLDELQRAYDEFSGSRPTSLSPGPPSSALVRCSQKMHTETKHIFAAAYCRYWQKKFVNDLKKLRQFRAEVAEAMVRSPTIARKIRNAPSHQSWLYPSIHRVDLKLEGLTTSRSVGFVLSGGEEPRRIVGDSSDDDRVLTAALHAMGNIYLIRYLPYFYEYPFGAVKLVFNPTSKESSKPNQFAGDKLSAKSRKAKEKARGIRRRSAEDVSEFKDAPAASTIAARARIVAGAASEEEQILIMLRHWCRSWSSK